MIEEDVIAAEYRPPTAITSPAQIDGLVAISDLPVNQVVVSNQFVSQAESLSPFSSLLKNNEVAITISIDQVRGVAGLLVLGDFAYMTVAVPGSDAPEGEAGEPTGGGDAVSTRRASYLFQKAPNIACGHKRAQL